jgi:hypothetical protein
VGGDEHEIGTWMLALDARQELQPGLTRHREVAQDEIHRRPFEGAEGLLGVLAALDVRLILEHLPGELPVESAVVDDDDVGTTRRLGHPVLPLENGPAQVQATRSGIGGPIFRLEERSRTAAG